MITFHNFNKHGYTITTNKCKYNFGTHMVYLWSLKSIAQESLFKLGFIQLRDF